MTAHAREERKPRADPLHEARITHIDHEDTNLVQAPEALAPVRLPVTVLSGFLGAGKTTLWDGYALPDDHDHGHQ